MRAIVWPTAGRTVLVAAYPTESTASVAAHKGVLNDGGRYVAEWLGE